MAHLINEMSLMGRPLRAWVSVFRDSLLLKIFFRLCPIAVIYISYILLKLIYNSKTKAVRGHFFFLFEK